MKRPAPDKPFEPLYAAKRDYEELRRGLSRALAQWTAGTVEFAEIFPAIEAFEEAHRKLIATIYQQGNQHTPQAEMSVAPAPVAPARKARPVKQAAR